MNNGYKPMESALRAADLADAADARFYRVSGIGVATLLGGLLGGGIVLSKNFQALGQPDRARKVLISCALGMVALLGIAFMLPDSIDLPGTGFTIVQIAVLYQYAKQTQEVDIAAHMEKGGAMHSNWRAAGIGVLVLLALAAIVFVVALMLALFTP